MKNKILLILIVFLVILAIASYFVYNYRVQYKASQETNRIFESYYNAQMLGTELVSVINKTEDINNKNNVDKNEQGMYIENDTNSIKVYIKLKYKDDYTTLEIEKILQDGTDNFIKTYGTASFKGEEISYHEKTGNVKAIVFTET